MNWHLQNIAFYLRKLTQGTPHYRIGSFFVYFCFFTFIPKFQSIAFTWLPRASSHIANSCREFVARVWTASHKPSWLPAEGWRGQLGRSSMWRIRDEQTVHGITERKEQESTQIYLFVSLLLCAKEKQQSEKVFYIFDILSLLPSVLRCFYLGGWSERTNCCGLLDLETYFPETTLGGYTFYYRICLLLDTCWRCFFVSFTTINHYLQRVSVFMV